jgi:hypothetical protein
MRELLNYRNFKASNYFLIYEEKIAEVGKEIYSERKGQNSAPVPRHQTARRTD